MDSGHRKKGVEMKPSRLWIYRLVTRVLPETRCFNFKACLLRWCGATVGTNVRISSSAEFLGAGDLFIGDDVWIGHQCFISPIIGSSVTIGSYCDIGPKVMVLTGTHEIATHGLHIAGKGIGASVGIGDGCWIGAGAIVLPGVKLLGKTVVAAGSVVATSSQHESILMAGVPATEKKIYK